MHSGESGNLNAPFLFPSFPPSMPQAALCIGVLPLISIDSTTTSGLLKRKVTTRGCPKKQALLRAQRLSFVC